MKKKIFIGFFAAIIATLAMFNITLNKDENNSFHLDLKRLEALAQYSGGVNPSEGGATVTMGYTLVKEKYEVYVGGTLTIKFRDVCKPVIGITIRCTF